MTRPGVVSEPARRLASKITRSPRAGAYPEVSFKSIVTLTMLYPLSENSASAVAALGGLLAAGAPSHIPGDMLHRQARPLRASPPATGRGGDRPHVPVVPRLRHHHRRHESPGMARRGGGIKPLHGADRPVGAADSEGG